MPTKSRALGAVLVTFGYAGRDGKRTRPPRAIADHAKQMTANTGGGDLSDLDGGLHGADAVSLIKLSVVLCREPLDARRNLPQKGVALVAVALEFQGDEFGPPLSLATRGLRVAGKLDGDGHKGTRIYHGSAVPAGNGWGYFFAVA